MGVIFGVFKKRKGQWADNLKGTDILFECYKWEGKNMCPLKPTLTSVLRLELLSESSFLLLLVMKTLCLYVSI